MKKTVMFTLLFSILLVSNPAFTQKKNAKIEKSKEKAKTTVVSFKGDVFPIIKKNCLPCHAEEQMNKSELNLDDYDQLVTGGEHGSPVVPGKADSSLIIHKLGPNPPFGKPMPLKAKEPLSAEDMKVITDWINQGAKKN